MAPPHATGIAIGAATTGTASMGTATGTATSDTAAGTATTSTATGPCFLVSEKRVRYCTAGDETTS